MERVIITSRCDECGRGTSINNCNPYQTIVGQPLCEPARQKMQRQISVSVGRYMDRRRKLGLIGKPDGFAN